MMTWMIEAHRGAPGRRALDHAARKRHDPVDHEVDEAGRGEDLQRQESAGGQILRHAGQLDDADDRDQRRGLEDQDRFVDERGQGQAHGDRRLDAAKDLGRRQPDHVGAFDQAARHAGKAAAQVFRLIGGGAQRQADDRCDDARHVEADGRQQIVDQQQLHQQRHAAEEADENPGGPDEQPLARQQSSPRSAWRSRSR